MRHREAFLIVIHYGNSIAAVVAVDQPVWISVSES